jgi:hypothetical protein
MANNDWSRSGPAIAPLPACSTADKGWQLANNGMKNICRQFGLQVNTRHAHCSELNTGQCSPQTLQLQPFSAIRGNADQTNLPSQLQQTETTQPEIQVLSGHYICSSSAQQTWLLHQLDKLPDNKFRRHATSSHCFSGHQLSAASSVHVPPTHRPIPSGMHSIQPSISC